ncbi:MAG TPA: MarC family protein [Chromatiaceae bacterium]|nr:MarC family protein [Chromatiaceae bacterium]
MWLQFVQALVLLLVIMDPLVSMTAFFSMTKHMRDKDKSAIAKKAVLVAAIPLVIFILGGNIMLEILHVDIETFKAAGGLILVLLGIQLSMGMSFKRKAAEDPHEQGAIAAIIGTPLITGPATISAAIILTDEMGMAITAAAGAVALGIAWVALTIGSKYLKHLGVTGARVLSTMLGLITIAWGMAFLKEGLLMP